MFFKIKEILHWGPCVVKILYFGITFLGAFCQQGKYIFWNLCKILRLLIPMKSILRIKIFLPLFTVGSAWHKKSWTTMKRLLGSKFLFAILGTFKRYLRGTFVENVKKIPKSTHTNVRHTLFHMQLLISTGPGGISHMESRNPPNIFLTVARHANEDPCAK
jgi:hypothetical protein